MIENGEKSAETLIAKITELIQSEPLAKIDYIKAVDADSIVPVSNLDGNVLVAVAVYIGKTRLIDNFISEGSEK